MTCSTLVKGIVQVVNSTNTIATSDIYSSIFFYRDIRNYLPIKINPQAKTLRKKSDNTWMH